MQSASTSASGVSIIITENNLPLLPVKQNEIEGLFLVTCVRYDPVLLEDHDWHSTKSGGDEKTPYLLLPYHVARLEAAARAFGWQVADRLLTRDHALDWFQNQCEAAIEEFRKTSEAEYTGAFKLRCLLGPSGDIEIIVKPVSTRPFDLLGAPYMTPAYLHPLTPTTLMTWPTAYAPILNVFLDVAPTDISGDSYYKHTKRDRYMRARERMSIDSMASVDEVILYNKDGEVTEGSLRTISVWREGGWVTPPLSSGCVDGSVRRWMLATKKVRQARLLKEDLRPGEWVLTCNGIEGCCFGKFVMMDREAYRKIPGRDIRGHDTLPGHSTIDYPR